MIEKSIYHTVKKPVALRPAVRKYSEGGDISNVAEDNFAFDPLVNVAPPPPATNTLSGNILAGASWNSLNPTLANQLTEVTGLPTLNTAVGGATTADTLKQLNDFIGSGGNFAPGSNVFLQTGGLDLVYGEDKDTIQNNIDQIISQLGQQGANVILTGSPYASSFENVVSNNFDPALDPIYGNLANKYQNVSLVDTMGSILQNKDLLSDSIHPNERGWNVYNQSVIDAFNALVARNNRSTEQS